MPILLYLRRAATTKIPPQVAQDTWQEALAYVQCGIYVIPVKPLSKVPAIKNWPMLGSNDPVRIAEWRAKYPDANIGILPGSSRLVIIDVDIKSRGQESFNGLVQDVGGLDVFEGVPRVSTPSGGFHLYFRKPEGCLIRTRRRLVPGVDLFSTSGHVVAPPSRVERGGYEWQHGAFIEPPLLPDSIARWLTAREREKSAQSHVEVVAASDLVTSTQDIPDGVRHTTLARMAGRMWDEGTSANAILAILTEIDARRCRPPVGVDDVRAITKWIVQKDVGFNACAYIRGWLPQLLGNEAILAISLADIAYPDGSIRVIQDRLHAATGLDRSAITKAARGLEQKGAIRRRFGAHVNGGREATTYHLFYASRSQF